MFSYRRIVDAQGDSVYAGLELYFSYTPTADSLPACTTEAGGPYLVLDDAGEPDTSEYL